MSDQKTEELRQLLRKAGPALLIDLIELLPDSLLTLALNTADGIRDRLINEHALRALAKRLPAYERARIFEELQQRASAPGEAPPSSLDQLRQILSGLSESEQESLIGMALFEIYEATRQTKSAPPPITLGGGTVVTSKGRSSKGRSKGGSKGGSKKNLAPGQGIPRPSTTRVPKMATSSGMEGDPEPPPTSWPRAPESTPEKDNVVKFGFSTRESPDETDAQETLKCGETYLFWLGVGEACGVDSIEVNETELDVENLPREEKLVVALFTFKDELEIVKGEDIGELQITESMSVKVAKQPMGAKAESLGSKRLETCLLFPVIVPERAGVFRLRCNIYCKQTLVQSRLISIVAQPGEPQKVDAAFFEKEKALFADDSPFPQHGVALYSEADFVLSQALTAALLPQTPHRLSLMLNSNNDGTHSFRFFGKQGNNHLKDDATLDEGELKVFVENGRGALREVSWGKTDEWNGQQQLYRYKDRSFDKGELARDLFRLAVQGYILYTQIDDKLTNNENDEFDLGQLMAEPGMVQIALKKSSRHVFPAALLYDYRLDTLKENVSTGSFELCQHFAEDVLEEAPLEEARCFNGDCWLKKELDKVATKSLRHLGELTRYVCPSGFWGYRHALGFPLTLGDAADVPEQMILRDSLEVVYGYSNTFDPSEHVQKLMGVREPHNKWHSTDDRDLVLDFLLEQKPHLVYFYCHGGLTRRGIPFIEVGDGKEQSDWIEPSNVEANFYDKRTRWTDPRPLVFINGCHTTAMSPEVAVKFVEAFVQKAHASGVIGTEITIFEPLARAFAEECLRRFLGGEPFKEPLPLGEAIRGARLALLKQGNPLGLVYIPFASAGLRLVKQETAQG